MKISILRQAQEAFDGVLDLADFDVRSTLAPATDNSLTNKAYVDSVASGLDMKESVQVTTTADIGGTYGDTGGTAGNGEFTGVANGIDGQTLVVGSRILVKDQTDPTQNGIYVVTDDTTTLTLERAEDHDGNPATEVSLGNFTFVEAGTVNASTGWVLASSSSGSSIITPDTDTQVWTQFNSQASYSAGFGLDLNGTVFSTDASDFADGTRGITTFVDGSDDKLALDGADVAGSGLTVGGSAWQLAVSGASTTVGNAAAVINVSANGVAVDVDLSTIGEIGGQLAVLDGGITEAKLDILDTPADGEILTWNQTAGKMEWQGVDTLFTDANVNLIQYTFQRTAPGAGQINVGTTKDLTSDLGAEVALTGSDILVFSNGILLENSGDPGYVFNSNTPSITLTDSFDGNPGRRYFDDGDIISVVVLAK